MSVFTGDVGPQNFVGEVGTYDQIDYIGSLSEYTISRNADGTISISHPDQGLDTATSIEGFWFAGEEQWYSLSKAIMLSGGTDDYVDPEHSVGTNDDDHLDGTSGNDELNGLDGDDVYCASNGDDKLDGGNGYDQVDYPGARADYTFTKNDDGTYTVVKPNGTDTLSNIEGIWFAGDEKWYAVSELADNDGDGSGGGSDDGFIRGTDGDDVLTGTDGPDVFIGSTGDDTITGGLDYDQVDYQGDRDDYTFTKNEDGTVTVVKPDGTDTLDSIEGFWFAGEEKWYSLEQVLESPAEPEPEPEPEPENNAPDAVDDSVNIEQNGSIKIDVLSNDTDADNDDLNIIDFSDAANGSISLNADGTFNYTANDGFSGEDSFTYQVSDGNGGFDSATVNINVAAPTNTASIGNRVWLDENENGVQDIGENGVAEVSVYLKNADGDIIDTMKTDDNGNYLFDELEAGDYSIGVTAPEDYVFSAANVVPDDTVDSDVNVATGMTETITLAQGEANLSIDAGVHTSNTAPIAVNDALTAVFGLGTGAVGTINVVANDSDPDGDDLTIIDFEQPDVGTLTLSADGKSLTFNQPVHQAFADQVINYTISDGKGGTATATLTIDWICPPSPIVLDLNGDGKIGVTGETSSIQKDADAELGRTVEFDIDADGDLERIEWVDGSGDGILVDHTKIGADGSIDGSALFGDEGFRYANGYEKLEAHDVNGDGQISGDELIDLSLWIDDGDAVLEDGELVSAADAGIASISTQMEIVYDEQGRELVQSTATDTNGNVILTEDVWFAEDLLSDGLEMAQDDTPELAQCVKSDQLVAMDDVSADFFEMQMM